MLCSRKYITILKTSFLGSAVQFSLYTHTHPHVFTRIFWVCSILRATSQANSAESILSAWDVRTPALENYGANETHKVIHVLHGIWTFGPAAEATRTAL